MTEQQRRNEPTKNSTGWAWSGSMFAPCSRGEHRHIDGLADRDGRIPVLRQDVQVRRVILPPRVVVVRVVFVKAGDVLHTKMAVDGRPMARRRLTLAVTTTTG